MSQFSHKLLRTIEKKKNEMHSDFQEQVAILKVPASTLL